MQNIVVYIIVIVAVLYCIYSAVRLIRKINRGDGECDKSGDCSECNCSKHTGKCDK